MLSLLYTRAFCGRAVPTAGLAAASSAGVGAHIASSFPKARLKGGACAGRSSFITAALAA